MNAAQKRAIGPVAAFLVSILMWVMIWILSKLTYNSLIKGMLS